MASSVFIYRFKFNKNFEITIFEHNVKSYDLKQSIVLQN